MAELLPAVVAWGEVPWPKYSAVVLRIRASAFSKAMLGVPDQVLAGLLTTLFCSTSTTDPRA